MCFLFKQGPYLYYLFGVSILFIKGLCGRLPEVLWFRYGIYFLLRYQNTP